MKALWPSARHRILTCDGCPTGQPSCHGVVLRQAIRDARTPDQHPVAAWSVRQAWAMRPGESVVT